MVEEGKFREDLYYRLHVMENQRAAVARTGRRCDGAHGLLSFPIRARAQSAALQAPAGRAVRALTDYSYPGNVRQLFNILEYAALMATDGVISLSSLPREVLGTDRPAILESQPAAQQQTLEQMLADQKLSDIERIAILATLKKNDGQKKTHRRQARHHRPHASQQACGIPDGFVRSS